MPAHDFLAQDPSVPGHGQLASDIRRALMTQEGVQVDRLAVRRLPNGVCLEGVIRVQSDDLDVRHALRQVDGIGQIINRLVVCWNCPDSEAAMPDETSF